VTRVISAVTVSTDEQKNLSNILRIRKINNFGERVDVQKCRRAKSATAGAGGSASNKSEYKNTINRGYVLQKVVLHYHPEIHILAS
jgi:hypothetical protein